VSAPDYLWPARPEYVRRGTPLRWLTGDGEYGRPGDLHLYCEQRGVPGDAVMRLCALDLRDVTARAHAAMAYTVISRSSAWAEAVADGEVLDDPTMMVEDDSEPGGVALTPEARRMVDILCRMRMLDESVTVDEAREALGWTERVAGVAP
jgi:hypothetical protein